VLKRELVVLKRRKNQHGKELLVKKIFITMNEHFIKLRDSDREEEREFYPGKTAEEMFLDTESESKSQG